MADSLDIIKFSISPYKGFENKILCLFNNNRPETQTIDYLNWAYLGEKAPIEPIVFWAHSDDGSCIGMSSFVFRSYWANNTLHKFAINRDLSINKKYRKKGIGKDLYQVIGTHIEKELFSCAFTIPNFGSQKVISSAGWKVEESLVPHVVLLDITNKIYKFIKNRWLANLLALPHKYFIRSKIFFAKTNGFYSKLVDDFDVSFDEFWQTFNKKNLIIRDKSASTLCWRYKKHPQIKFLIYKIFKNDKFIGFIVYTLSKLNNVCSIYEIIVQKKEYVKQAMNLFIKEIIQRENPALVRIVLNENHQYSSILKNIGFVRRGQDGVFQTYIPKSSGINKNLKWFITQGDKDI